MAQHIMQRTRVTVAFAVAPLATPAAIACVFLCAWILRLGWFKDKTFDLVAGNIVAYAGLATPLAYGATATLGIPAYLLARGRGWISLRHAWVIGTAVALVPLYAYFAYVVAYEGRVTALGPGNSSGLLRWNEVDEVLWWSMLFGLSGAVSGMAFWVIGLRRPSGVTSREGERAT